MSPAVLARAAAEGATGQELLQALGEDQLQNLPNNLLMMGLEEWVSGLNAQNVYGTLDVTSDEAQTVLVDTYRNMKKNPDVTGQVHHLNQYAAFKGYIPYQ